MGAAPPAEMRARFNQDVIAWNLDPPPLARVEDLRVPTARREVPVRLYDATGMTARPGHRGEPAIIFYHGGGWVVGDLDSNDRAMRLLALESGVTVISVDYCLAPEHKFPEPLDECLAVARWIHCHGAAWRIDPQRLALGGDSAGANLALATALDLRDAGENWLKYLLLIYGVYARDHDTDSHRRFGGANFGLGTQGMDALWSLYVANRADSENPRAAPLRAQLAGLPAAYVVAGGLDPLRDDSRRLAAHLIEVGGAVEYCEYPGMIHGFMSMTLDLSVTRSATTHAAASLRRALAAAASGTAG
jgi:acetyl esterase